MPYFAMKIDWLSQTASTPDIEIGICDSLESDKRVERKHAAFIAVNWLCRYIVMPFGFCNAPATFERLISSVVRDMPLSSCLGDAIARVVKAYAGTENFTRKSLPQVLIDLIPRRHRYSHIRCAYT